LRVYENAEKHRRAIVAGFGPIVLDPGRQAASLFRGIGLPFKEDTNGYLHTAGWMA